MRRNGRVRPFGLLSGGAAAVLMLGGCGGSPHFQNKPRPPVPIQLTGVVTDSSVTVSPDHIGGGPIVLDISNQTQQAHTIVLERAASQGEPNRDTIGPINPLQSSPLTQTLTPGEYTVSAGSNPAGIAPAIISVGAGGTCSGGRKAGPDGLCPNSSTRTELP